MGRGRARDISKFFDIVDHEAEVLTRLTRPLAGDSM